MGGCAWPSCLYPLSHPRCFWLPLEIPLWQEILEWAGTLAMSALLVDWRSSWSQDIKEKQLGTAVLFWGCSVERALPFHSSGAQLLWLCSVLCWGLNFVLPTSPDNWAVHSSYLVLSFPFALILSRFQPVWLQSGHLTPTPTQGGLAKLGHLLAPWEGVSFVAGLFSFLVYCIFEGLWMDEVRDSIC